MPAIVDVAVRSSGSAIHLVAGLGFTVTVGKRLTVTTDVACAVQPFDEVPVTVYVVVAVGLAVTEAPVLADNAVFGIQL